MLTHKLPLPPVCVMHSCAVKRTVKTKGKDTAALLACPQGLELQRAALPRTPPAAGPAAGSCKERSHQRLLLPPRLPPENKQAAFITQRAAASSRQGLPRQTLASLHNARTCSCGLRFSSCSRSAPPLAGASILPVSLSAEHGSCMAPPAGGAQQLAELCSWAKRHIWMMFADCHMHCHPFPSC